MGDECSNALTEVALRTIQLQAPKKITSDSKDAPTFLPVHQNVLKALVSTPFIVGEEDRIWKSIESFVTQRNMLLQAHKDSVISAQIHQQALCWNAADLILAQAPSRDEEEAKERKEEEEDDEEGNVLHTEILYQKPSNEISSSSTPPSPPPLVSSSHKRKSRRTSYQSSDDMFFDEDTSTHHYVHVVSRMLGCRSIGALDTFQSQKTLFEPTRAFVKQRIETVTARLREVQDTFNDEKQEFLQKVVSFDLYKVRPSSSPIVPGFHTHNAKSLSELESLHTELHLWTLLQDDMNSVFDEDGDKNDKVDEED